MTMINEVLTRDHPKGQTSLLFNRNGREHEDILEESEGFLNDWHRCDDNDICVSAEDRSEKQIRDKSATLRKMRATGTVRAALSPRKSPKSITMIIDIDLC